MSSETVDVAVVGGGPAGSSAAGFLAKRGRSVVLLESEEFPRHHVGESTLQGLAGLLEAELGSGTAPGVGTALSRAGFRVKTGGSFVWGKTREPWSFHFTDSDDPSHLDEVAFQVERSMFDQILLDHARDTGVDVRYRSTVEAPVLEGDRVTGLVYHDSAGTRHTIEARYVIDASGLRSAVGRHLGIQRRYEGVRNVAVYGYWDTAELPYRELGGDILASDRSNILIVRADRYWIWFIPLRDRISVGVVASLTEVPKIREQGPTEFYHQRIRECAEAARLLRGVSPLEGEPVRTVRDWSQIADRLSGPGYFLAGDAAAFVDPILSSGVHLAVTFGINCGRTVNTMFVHGDDLSWAPQWYESAYRASYEDFRRMADAWYLGSGDCESWFDVARDRIKESLDVELSQSEAFTRMAAGTLTIGSFADRVCATDTSRTPALAHFSPITNRYSYTVDARQRMSEYLDAFPDRMIPQVFDDAVESASDPVPGDGEPVDPDELLTAHPDVRIGIFSERGNATLSAATYLARTNDVVEMGMYAPLHATLVESFGALGGGRTPRSVAGDLGVAPRTVCAWLEPLVLSGFLTRETETRVQPRPADEVGAVPGAEVAP